MPKFDFIRARSYFHCQNILNIGELSLSEVKLPAEKGQEVILFKLSGFVLQAKLQAGSKN